MSLMINRSLVTATILFIFTLYGIAIGQQGGSCSQYSGCCTAADSANCLGTPKTCYCDQSCYYYQDCCSDIAQYGCVAPSATPTATPTGSCASVGFIGCCDVNVHLTCHGSDGVCYCDQSCYLYGDCCPDISSVGCYANVSSPQASPTSGSCAAAGFENCCSPGNTQNGCYGSPPTCFCDQLCYDFNDCCPDISSICEGTPSTDHGTCAGLGYSGCCKVGVGNTNITFNCHGNDGICYCDEACHLFGDCCSDIDEIGCTAPVTVTPSTTLGSCAAAGYIGCCNPLSDTICWGSGSNCYCDELCYSFNDCCYDVAAIGCIAPSVSPIAGDGTCIGAGHLVCCVPSDTNSCLGSNGICSCSADCFDSGTCCKDIHSIGCVIPSPTAGPCQLAGYSQCCLPSQQNGASCFGDPPSCYCDEYCFTFGDCCSDVTSIGCLKPSVILPAPNGSCVEAGYTSCCVPTTNDHCHGHPESCYCDEECHNYGDCCNDVGDIGCSPLTSGSCLAANYKSCCADEDLSCVGFPNSNCFCDQACSLRGDCCSDRNQLKNCTELTIPGPVNNLMAIASSNTAFLIMWDPPTYPNDLGHYEIVVTNYTGEGAAKRRIQHPFDVLQDTVDGLSPFKPYNVTVFGVNINGRGLNTTVVNFTQQGVPTGGPDNIKILHTGTTLQVSWSPLNLLVAQGYVVMYQVQYFPSSDVTHVKTVNAVGTSVTIPHVDSATHYGVKVAGVTAAGTGAFSSSAFEGVPGPVNNLMAMASNSTTFLIMWDAPTHPNNLGHYEVVVTNYSGEGAAKRRIQHPFDRLQDTVDGLSPFKPYNVTVFGVNINGRGINTTVVNFTQQGVPTGGPDNLRVSRSGTKLQVSWSPLDLQVAQGFVIMYQVQYFPSTNVTRVMTVNTTGTSVTIQNVNGIIRYGVKVAGITAAGLGTYSKSSYERGVTHPKSSVSISTIVGSIFGGVIVLAVVIVTPLVVILVIKTRRRHHSGRLQYKRLLVQANEEYEDDDDDDE